MTITEETRDLFTVPQGYYLAHCISGDFALGAGIAKKFNEVYDMRFKLFRDFDEGEVGRAYLVDNVFNLVTKPRYFDKPTYETLENSLRDMKERCEDLGVAKLAIPLLGCGLDRLDWSRVCEIIVNVFEDMNIDILVCRW